MKINEEEIHTIKRFGFNNISQLLLVYCGLELDNKRLEEKIQKFEKQDNYILKINTENTKKLNEMKEQLKLERKVALSLNKPYTVSVIDRLLGMIDNESR